MMLLNNGLNKDSIELENIKNKIFDKVFALKLYEDGTSYSGFIDDANNSILNLAIYKDIDGRRFMGNS